MSDPLNYATGGYSISPAFTWWNANVHRMDTLKARREAERVAEETKRQKKTDSAKIAEGTISVYA
jgi:hypothetical protein